MQCQWIFGEVRRGQPVRQCPMETKDEHSAYCVFHHRRSRQKVTMNDLKYLADNEKAA